MFGRQLIASVFLLAAVPFAGAADKCAPNSVEQVAVSEVVDQSALRLANGEVLRLAGVTVPPAFRAAARQALADLVGGKTVQLGNRSASPDRYGRVVAQAFTADGSWVQGEILRRGLALVMTFRDARACGGALLAAEAEARKASTGLWTDPDFAIAAAENPSFLGRGNVYQVVEGRVFSVGKTPTTVYLDFGRNWATDFTVTVGTQDAALLESEGLALHDLGGRRVRVRGWLSESNGPMIRVDHREQIEVLDR